MTPKEKANELGNKFYQGSVFDYNKKGHLEEIKRAKKCALIYVDETLSILNKCEGQEDLIYYYQKVKQEIQKL